MLIDDLIFDLHQKALKTGQLHVDHGRVRTFLQMLHEAMVLRIDNVATYIERDLHSRIALKDIPTIAPLAPVVWTEMNQGSIGGHPGFRTGCLMVSFPAADHPDIPLPEGIRLEDVGWTYVCTTHREVEASRGGIFHCPFASWFFIGKEGKILHQEFIGNTWNYEPEIFPSIHEQMSPELRDNPLIEMFYPLAPTIMAICFAHCRNVTLEKREQGKNVRRKAYKVSPQKKLLSYHTINIQAATRILEQDGDIEHNGAAKALHICRGHFAHYTDAAPLFGKLTGTFYRPMHIRGQDKEHAVRKDYRVHSQQGEEA